MQVSIEISSSVDKLNGQTSSPPSVLPLSSALFLSGLFTGASCLVKEQPLCCASPGPPLAVAVERNGRTRCGCCLEEARWPRAWEWRGEWRASGTGMASLPSLPEPSEQGQPEWGQASPKSELRGLGLRTGPSSKEAPKQITLPSWGADAHTEAEGREEEETEIGEWLWDRKRGGSNHCTSPQQEETVLTVVLTPSCSSWCSCLLSTYLPTTNRCLCHRGAPGSPSDQLLPTVSFFPNFFSMLIAPGTDLATGA